MAEDKKDIVILTSEDNINSYSSEEEIYINKHFQDYVLIMGENGSDVIITEEKDAYMVVEN